jgi:hypothetical protein
MEIRLEAKMRYTFITLTLFAAACSGGASATAPTSPSSPSGGVTATQARAASALPFEGSYEGLETVGTVPSNHHLDATGNATHLGLFTVAADWTIAAGSGSGTSRWTAANGDEVFTSFARHGVVTPPTITFTETHAITGGTGRFANASGTFTVVQTRGLSMPYNNSATLDGTIDFNR